MFKSFSVFSTLDFTAFHAIIIFIFIKKIMASKNFSTFLVRLFFLFAYIFYSVYYVIL